MIPVYASVADYEAVHGPVVGDAASTLPTDLERASALVRRATTAAVYDVDDTTGLPTDPDTIAAMRSATIDTARALLVAASDEAKAFPSGPVESITQGGRSVTFATPLALPPAQSAAAGRVTPDAWNTLRAAGLTGWGLR